MAIPQATDRARSGVASPGSNGPGWLRLPAKRYLIFATVALALLMASIDSTIVAVALQAIRSDLHTSIVWSTWTLTAYQLGQLVILPVAGKMSDEWGRKRVFIASVLLFTISSLLCAVAPNVYFLILFRVLQALGGGSFLPSCTGIVAEEFQENRAQAIGLFTSIFPIGGILGPNIGGLLVDHLSWRFVFFVNIPFGVVVIVFTALLYREQVAEVSHKIDFAGAAIYGVAMISLLLGLTWIGENTHALTNPLLWGVFAFALLALLFFFRWEGRTEEPVIDPVLLKHRPFLAANLYNLFFGAGVFGFTSFVPIYFQLRYKLSATAAGALLTPRALAMIALSMVASIYLIRLGYRAPMIAGLVFQSLSLLLLSRGHAGVSLLGFHFGDIVWLGFVMVLSGIGFGISQPAANNAALDLLPGKVAAVTGIRQVFRFSGGVVSVSLIGVVLANYSDEALGLQRVFFVLFVLNILLIPLTFLIPDRAREHWRSERDAHRPDGGTSGLSTQPLRDAVIVERSRPA